MNQYRTLSLFILLFLLLVACQNESSPLPTATAVSSTQPIIIAEQSATALPSATFEPPTTTPEPTTTATAIPTAVPTSTIIPNTILSPETVLAGETLTISGSWNQQTAVSLQINVQISDWLLAEGETAVSEDGSWEAALPLPPQISGVATITVAAEDMIINPLTIEANIEDNLPYVTLNKPSVGQTAVSGYGIFFDGVVNRPIGGTLVIGILVDNCTRFATGQTFELGNGSWSGLLVIPSDISGNACAIARTGDPDAGEEWVAAIVPLPILATEDVAARRILLGNSRELVFKSGKVAEFFGTAVNAPNNQVNLLLTSDDGSHILLGEAAVPANSYGYWEADMLLSDNYSGFALLVISIGTGENYIEQRIPITIGK